MCGFGVSAHSHEKTFENSRLAGLVSFLNDNTSVNQFSIPYAEFKSDKVYVEESVEDETEEFSLIKKNHETNKYLTGFFNASTAKRSGYYSKERLPVFQYFSYCSSSRYILLRVIRI
jgi:hypothetical protein